MKTAPPPSSTARSTPGAALRPGRPTLCDDSILHSLCALIRADGLSDSAAADRLGLSPSSISRWKSARPEFQLALRQARELFRAAKLDVILHARKSDGSPDWRAAAWLLEHIFPEDYARNRQRVSATEESSLIDSPAPGEDSTAIVGQAAPSATPLPTASSGAITHRTEENPAGSDFQNVQNTSARRDVAPPSDSVLNSDPSPNSFGRVLHNLQNSAAGHPASPSMPSVVSHPQSPRLTRRERRQLERTLHRQAA